MIFDIRNRQEGKTRDSVVYMLNNPDTDMVVFSEGERHRIVGILVENSSQTPGYWMSRVVVYSNSQTLRGRRDKKVIIDNVDIILRSLYGDVVRVTATGTTE